MKTNRRSWIKRTICAGLGLLGIRTVAGEQVVEMEMLSMPVRAIPPQLVPIDWITKLMNIMADFGTVTMDRMGVTWSLLPHGANRTVAGVVERVQEGTTIFMPLEHLMHMEKHMQPGVALIHVLMSTTTNVQVVWQEGENGKRDIQVDLTNVNCGDDRHFVMETTDDIDKQILGLAKVGTDFRPTSLFKTDGTIRYAGQLPQYGKRYCVYGDTGLRWTDGPFVTGSRIAEKMDNARYGPASQIP